MALIRWKRPETDVWDPFGSLSHLQDEMNRMFDTSLRRFTMGEYEGAFLPAIDLVDEKDKFIVRAELPGMKKEDVHVVLQDNWLTISGEKKHEAESKETNYYRTERVYGTFTRRLELPTGVDAKKIDAQFKDGVLHISLPKTEEAKPREIEVKVN
jgi:HSP20 family protein